MAQAEGSFLVPDEPLVRLFWRFLRFGLLAWGGPWAGGCQVTGGTIASRSRERVLVESAGGRGLRNPAFEQKRIVRVASSAGRAPAF